MEGKDNQTVVHTPTWEKVFGLVGFVFLCVGTANLVWSDWTDEKSPPDIVINIKNIEPISKGFLVEIEVVNNGSHAVSLLQVEVN